jgi:hypothetical protein
MITITVEGLGGIISTEVEIIKRALEAYNFNVHVEDSEAFKSVDLADRALERFREHNGTSEYPIRLIAKHLPWGG